MAGREAHAMTGFAYAAACIRRAKPANAKTPCLN
jgi:hypothetical protein